MLLREGLRAFAETRKVNDRMKHILFLLTFAVIATFTVGCSLYSLDEPQPQGQPQPTMQSAPTQSIGNLPPPGPCQARLWGKVTNDKGQTAANITVDIATGSFKAKTATDSNGLYGFAGLCAGEYTFNVTPPNGKPQPAGDKTPLDGGKQVKVDLTYKQ